MRANNETPGVEDPGGLPEIDQPPDGERVPRRGDLEVIVVGDVPYC